MFKRKSISMNFFIQMYFFCLHIYFFLLLQPITSNRNSMEEKDKMSREELFSRPVRAGKRTYFFDVKATRNDEKYITITESKRHFSDDQSHFSYEKHKIFLYKEDFEMFATALKETLNYIETGEYPEGYFDEPKEYEDHKEPKDEIEDWFDSLDNK